MLTPRFELLQTDNELIVKVHAPYANIKDTEVYVEGTDVRFFSSPYYLRLKLPGEIIENDQSSGSYDCNSGQFTLKFSKVNPGEHFDNLDMITTLLAPPKQKKNFVSTIEVIGNPAVTNENSLVDNDTTNGNEWFYPQTNLNNNPIVNLLEGPRYGFANKIVGALESFEQGWLKDVVDLPFPDSTPMTNRRGLREVNEKYHFSDDHYTADLIQPEDSIKRIIDFQPSFYTTNPESLEFSTTEQDILKELPNKEFLLTNEESRIALLSLVDILFSYCYNHRVTMGENTSESSWDINKISSTLSWFDYFIFLEDVVKSCIRRSLCFPLYRYWELSIKVLDDVNKILALGKKSILKSLCEIHGLFNNSYDPRYVLNQLYIRDYLIWVQRLPEATIKEILGELEAVKIEKKDVGLDLVELEAAAWSVLEEEKVEKLPCVVNIEAPTGPKLCLNRVVDKMNKLVITNRDSDDESTSSDDDSSSSSSSCCDKSNCKSCCSSTSSESSLTSNDSDSSSDVSTSSEDVIKSTNNKSNSSSCASTDSDDSRD
ncbi:protein SHQ1 homolog [Chelonus insularis]|uniref:protein SHQ1 homolog n=1 Tax=Chelonus insularis TaxID=460826 RepID=UPI001588C48F|nr:protein SHQ1 homolog [Chelonus insularis]